MANPEPGWLDPGEEEAIRGAVSAAERSTSGEIVPVLLSAADEYEVAFWKAATLGGLAGELAGLAALELGSAWPRGSEVAGALLVPGLAGALLAALAVLLFKRLRPLVAGGERVERR